MKLKLLLTALLLAVAVPAMAWVPCDTGPPRTREIVSLGNGNYEFVGSIMESAWTATLKEFRRQHPGLAVSGIKIGNSKYLDGCYVNELSNITFHTAPVPATPVRLKSAYIKPPSQREHSGIYTLELTFVTGDKATVPFIAGSLFSVVEDATLDGTYATVRKLPHNLSCTIYVRAYGTKQAWETILGRYDPHIEEPVPVDVTPTEPIGF